MSTATLAAAPAPAEKASIRALRASDLDAVMAIDAAAQGYSRRAYLERRLEAAQRDPKLHAQLAAVDAAGSLVGHMLARLLEGEFGLDQKRPALRLELLGVRPEWRRRGVGHALFEALTDWARRHGVAEIRTAALWRDTSLLAWFAAQGFELAADQFVEVAVNEATLERGEGASPNVEADAEIDYGRPESNDHERLARDRADVRSMVRADLDAIVRIDRALTGRDRREYMSARLAEALGDAAVRVSLAAHAEGTVVGYLMARADLGDFGRTAPVAVMDTLGVAPEYEHHGIGHALLSQLMANLGALRVERVETIVPQRNLALLGFLYAAGFKPGERLAFRRRL